MFWKQHRLGGIITWFSLSVAYWFYAGQDLLPLALSLPAALFFSRLPDIDTNKSRIFREVRSSLSLALGGLGAVYGILYLELHQAVVLGVAGFGLTYILLGRLPLEHRGLVHTMRFGFFASALVFLGFYYLFSELGVSQALVYSGFIALQAFAAFLSHLVLDSHVKA